MNHLTDSELVDALDGSLPAATTAHVRDCASCQRRLADLTEALATARHVDVPEPSPLFWDHLSARVRDAIAEYPRPAGRPWLSWPVLVPLGGLAILVVALVWGVMRPQAPIPTILVSSDVRLLEDEALEAAWALTANLVGTPEAVVALETELVVSLGSAEVAAAQLTPDEQAELVRLLQLEIKSGG